MFPYVNLEFKRKKKKKEYYCKSRKIWKFPALEQCSDFGYNCENPSKLAKFSGHSSILILELYFIIRVEVGTSGGLDSLGFITGKSC